jgi:hypothetical protein
MPLIRGGLQFVILAVCSCFPAALHADTVPVVLIGQLAPGTEGGRFSSVGAAAVNASGMIAFRADYAGGGWGHEAVFEAAGGNIAPIAREGDPVGDLPGAAFFRLGDPQINSAGHVAFRAIMIRGTSRFEAIILRSAGTLRTIAHTDMQVPGTAGQKFASFGSNIRLNDSGDIGFIATLEAPVRSGVFMASQGTIQAVAIEGLPLQGTDEIFEYPNGFSMNNRRDFVVVSGSSRLVLVADGAATVVAGSGFPFAPSINDAREIVFVTRIEVQQPRGPAFLSPVRIVRWRNGTFSTIAQNGDPLPQLPGAVFTAGFQAPQVDSLGGIVFTARISANGQAADAIIHNVAGSMRIAAQQGDFIDGLGTLDFIGEPRFNPQKGLLTFVSGMSAAAPVQSGVFASDNEPSRLLFPQIADGRSAGGNWRTTLVLANRTSVPVPATVNFYDDSGGPMSLSIGGRQQSQAHLEIPPLGIIRLQTDGGGSLKTGWSSVQAHERLSGIALLGFFDDSNNLINEVGANAIVPLRSMSIFVETGPAASTGIAIANPNDFINPADVSLILRDSSSNEISRVSLTISSKAHLARYVSELFPNAPASFEGKIEVVSSQPLIALTLRQRENVFTSLPVIP